MRRTRVSHNDQSDVPAVLNYKPPDLRDGPHPVLAV